MRWFGADKEIKATSDLVGEVGNVFDKLFTSDDERLGRQEVMARLKNAPYEVMGRLAQLDAVSRNPFQAGWRPFVGWIAGFSLSLYFIPQFAVGAYIFIDTYISSGEIIAYPVKPDALMELVWALLGLGAFRTVEKMNGKAK